MFRFGKFPESDALKRFVVVAVMLVALVGMVYVPPLVSVGNAPLWRGTGMATDAAIDPKKSVWTIPQIEKVQSPEQVTWPPYAPLAVGALHIERQIFGDSQKALRLVSLLLHAVATVLLYAALRR